MAQSVGGTNGLLQITGLASGLDTNSIITALINVDRQPIVNLQTQQSSLQALNNSLTGIQSMLRSVALNAQGLQDPGLFARQQTVTSSDSNLVMATSTNGIGGVVGGSTVTVGQLASAAQRTFTFTSPTAADTLTVDGQQVSLAAGASVQDLANAINSNPNVDVWAGTNQNGDVVLSTRATGNNGATFIQLTDPGSSLVEQAALAQNGQDAQYTINGVAGSSHSDTLTGAIPGVTLTLNGVTPATAPVTINVQPPSLSSKSIEDTVNTFVQSYNSALQTLQGQVTTKPTSVSPNTGLLFGDGDLRSLISSMRSSMYQPGAGLPAGMASLADIGITTGAATGSGFSQSAVQGNLTVDKTKLEQAIQNNPSGVQSLLKSWSQNFTSIVNAEASAGGSLDGRIQGESARISQMGDQITNMQEALTRKQTTLQAQFAALEGTLSQLQSQSTWMNTQIAQMFTKA